MQLVKPLLMAGGLAIAGWGIYHALPPRALPTTAVLAAPVPPPVAARPAVRAIDRPSPSLADKRAGDDQRQALQTVQQALAAVDVELAALRQRVDRLSALYQTSQAEQPPPQQEAEQQQAAEYRAQERLALLERSVSSQGVDSEWSAQSLSDIEQALGDEALLDTAIYDIDCRATLCRVEVGHDDPNAFDQFQQQFLNELDELFTNVWLDYTDLGGGATGTVIYLARDGHALPELDRPE